MHEDLLLQIYGAAGDPVAWRGVLDALATRLRAQSACVFFADEFRPEVTIAAAAGVFADQAVQTTYLRDWMALDAAIPLHAGLAAGETTITSRAFTRDHMARDPFYQDYYTRELGLADCLGIGLANKDERSGYLAVQRAVGQPLFSPADAATLRRLGPHLMQAFALHRRLTRPRDPGKALSTLLEAMTGPALCIRADQEICAVNAAAEALLSAGDGIGVDSRRRLTLADHAAHGRLWTMLRPLLGGEPGASGGKVIAGRGLDRMPLMLLASRPPVIGAEADNVARALVAIHDPDQPSSDIAAAAAHYRFTQAESRLIEALLKGVALVEYADLNGITLNAVRFHLKGVFAKTGARSQSDLMRLVIPLR